VLRYHLELDVSPDPQAPAHRALQDVLVTASLFRRMLAEEDCIEKMIAAEKEPALLPRVTFGKHKGKAWRDVPDDYLEWMCGQDFDADREFCARQELALRAKQQPIS